MFIIKIADTTKGEYNQNKIEEHVNHGLNINGCASSIGFNNPNGFMTIYDNGKNTKETNSYGNEYSNGSKSDWVNGLDGRLDPIIQIDQLVQESCAKIDVILRSKGLETDKNLNVPKNRCGEKP